MKIQQNDNEKNEVIKKANRVFIKLCAIHRKMKHWRITVILLVGLAPLYTFSQTVALELRKMNVVYVGVDNPIKIAVENYPCEKIVINPTYGTIKLTSDSCHYSYKIDSCQPHTSKEIIYVGVKEGKTIKWLDTLEYRIKKIPVPQLCIGSYFGGLIKKNIWYNSNYVLAVLKDIDLEDYATITNYSYEIWRKDSLIYKEIEVKGNSITKNLRNEIYKSQKGDIYFFFDIFAETSYDKCLRKLQSVKFEIE